MPHHPSSRLPKVNSSSPSHPPPPFTLVLRFPSPPFHSGHDLATPMHPHHSFTLANFLPKNERVIPPFYHMLVFSPPHYRSLLPSPASSQKKTKESFLHFITCSFSICHTHNSLDPSYPPKLPPKKRNNHSFTLSHARFQSATLSISLTLSSFLPKNERIIPSHYHILVFSPPYSQSLLSSPAYSQKTKESFFHFITCSFSVRHIPDLHFSQ